MAKKKEARVYSAEFKRKAVERFENGEPAQVVAKDLEIARKLVYDWKKRVDQGQALDLRGRPRKSTSTKDETIAAARAEIEVLQRLVGQLTAENHFFHSALRKLEPTARSGNGKAGSRISSGN